MCGCDDEKIIETVKLVRHMKYNYNEVIHIIENTRRFGNLTGYEVSKQMLEQLGNPQSGIPFVHVAGTNGKGSTTAFLCKILEQTGKKVGMFTSPHLITFEERIRINGEYISKEDVTRLGNQLLEMDFQVSPTMFDYCLAMAVLYFKEKKCDIVVMETGIGGRYDSTNALGVPEVAIITKIGLDHTAILGDTIEAIAHEKAGIIKTGGIVVTSPQETTVKQVLYDYFLLVNGVQYIEITENDLEYVKTIPMKMQGAYQVENAATAVVAARCLFEKWNKEGSYEATVNEQDSWIRAGISGAFWKGRMELINDKPFFMIDGAHNAHGVHALAESLKKLYPGEKFHFIMGVMADKDYEEMIEELLPLAVDFSTVTPESNRALQSKDLAGCITKKGVKARYAENMEAVIRPFLPQHNQVTESTTVIKSSDKDVHVYLADDEHKIVAFGSLYFIGAIEAMLEENNK